MPFYDYKCKKCGNQMEMQLRNYEDKTIPCSECNGDAERQYNFRFQAHGLPNGFIGNPRRTSLDKRIDPKTFVSKNSETL